MKIIPLGDKVVVQRLDAEEVTEGGIVLPDTAREKPKQGKILSVGDGKMLDNGRRQKPSVQEGDRVVFSSWAGSQVQIDGNELLIMAEDDILALIS